MALFSAGSSKRGKDSDDGDHDQQFNQCECAGFARIVSHLDLDSLKAGFVTRDHRLRFRSSVLTCADSISQRKNIMTAKEALWVVLEAKPGKEKELENFLTGALPLVQAEPATIPGTPFAWDRESLDF